MMKSIVSFLLMTMLMGLLMSGVSYSNYNMNATRLTVDMTDVATTATVRSTEGFLESDIVWVGDEKMAYNGTTDTTFTNITRAYGGTQAAAHSAGNKVYSVDSDWVNTAMGFRIVDTGASAGRISIITTLWRFTTTTIPLVLSWDYAYLKQGIWQYVRYVFILISIGWVISFGLAVASMLGGVLQSIFRRG